MAGPPQSAIAVCAVCGDGLRAEQQRVAASLTAELTRAFVYPFKPAVLLTLGIVALVTIFVQFVPLLGNPLSAAIVLGTFFLILRSTAEGRDDLASDVDISGNIWLWFSPLIRYLLTLVVAYLPAVAVLIFLGWPAGAPFVVVLALLGTVYVPAGMIVAGHDVGCLGPVNAVPAVRIIGRIPGPYFLTLGFLILSLVAGAVVMFGAQSLSKLAIPILPTIVARVLGLYAPAVMARQLGLLVREHGEEL